MYGTRAAVISMSLKKKKFPLPPITQQKIPKYPTMRNLAHVGKQ